MPNLMWDFWIFWSHFFPASDSRMPCSSRISQTWNDIFLGKILGNKEEEMKLNFNVVFVFFMARELVPPDSRRGDFQGYLSRWLHFELICDLCRSIAKCFVAWASLIVDWLALPDLVQKRESIKIAIFTLWIMRSKIQWLNSKKWRFDFTRRFVIVAAVI